MDRGPTENSLLQKRRRRRVSLRLNFEERNAVSAAAKTVAEPPHLETPAKQAHVNP